MANDINSKWPWPQNVGVLGTYPEEIKALQKLEKNPEASPIPEAAPTNFLDPKTSSEHLRVGTPRAPRGEVEVPGNFVPLHVVVRRLLMRRKKTAWGLFDEAVETEDLGELPASRREQMRAMLKRERAMLEMIARYNELAEDVYARLLSESKG
jgi:hypothetical protein